MCKIESGDIVSIYDTYSNRYWDGEITIDRGHEAKFLPLSGDCPYNYDYFPKTSMILILKSNERTNRG